MPARKLPSDEYPDPLTLLRDAEWDQHWPVMILRGIYDIMASERRAGRGSLMQTYIKAFNITVLTLVRKSSPRRATVSNGTLTLTPFGVKINDMYAGTRKVRGKPGTYIMRRYGKKSKQEMARDLRIKIKKLRIWIDILKRALPDKMPDRSPTRIT